MADEKNENSDNSTQVDIETVKVKLIIVCKDQALLEPVATFLNRRGWEAHVTTKVKEALATASTVKPDFVLVSANNPNPKLMEFPQILMTASGIPCIGFGEGTDAKTLCLLEKLPVAYKIGGDLSGPNTLRQIKQILKEKYGHDVICEDAVSEAPKTFGEDFSLDPNEIADIIAGVQKEIPAGKTVEDPQDSKKDEAPKKRNYTRNPKKVSFFEKAIIKILNEIRTKKMPLMSQVTRTDRIAIISVQSPNLSGYLVLTSTVTVLGLRELSLEVINKLADFLRQEAKMYEFGSLAMVMSSEHEFFDTNAEHLEFCHVKEFADGELGIKFLSAPQAIPKLQRVVDEPKYYLDVEAIPVQRPVDFKMYIHLEKNQKYMVLVKESGVLTAKYKERLLSSRKRLFIDDSDLENFKRFVATSAALDLLKLESYRVEYAAPAASPQKAA